MVSTQQQGEGNGRGVQPATGRGQGSRGSLASRTATLLALLSAVVGWTALVPPAGAAAATAVSSGIHQDGSSAVTLKGPWTTVGSSHASGGTYANLAAAGYAQVTFSGTGVRWLSRTTRSGGIALASVDGAKAKAVDLYSATTKDQQAAYVVRGLRAGTHTLRIVRTGTKNAAATGRNLLLDAVDVLDSVAPPAPTAPSAVAARTGARLTWKASPARDLARYRVYRSAAAGGAATLVGATTSTNLLDIGLPDATTYRYTVAAVDTSGNVSARSTQAVVTTAAAAAPTALRYASCPAATVTVSTGTQLTAALAAARPGSVIRLEPGRYTGQFTVSVQATAAAPVWVCGPRTAVVDAGDPARRGGFVISASSHVVLAGVTVRDSLKGVMVRHSTDVTVADLRLEDIGDEAVHLLDFTTDSTVVGNSIHGTGLVDPQYGEGVYVGTADNNWCAFSECQPDASDRNAVLGNDISATGSEPIEAKVATSGGLVSGNTINGAGMRATAYALIYVKGNDWVVSHNVGSDSPTDGILVVQRNPGWGMDNIVFDNNFHGSIPRYGVELDAKDLGNLVGCGVQTGTDSIAATSKACQP